MSEKNNLVNQMKLSGENNEETQNVINELEGKVQFLMKKSGTT